MPGYTIHLAIGKVYEKNNEIKDIDCFEKGIIAPDLEKEKDILNGKDRNKSHYGVYTNSPDFKRFLNEKDIEDEFYEGYFLHLVTDYLFSNKYLEKWDKFIYDDYDILNDRIIKKYKIALQNEIKETVKKKDGELTLLNEEDIDRFINIVGNINIKNVSKDNIEDFIKMLEKIQFKE